MGLALHGQWNLFGEYGVHPSAPQGATATIAVLDSGFDAPTGGGWDFVSDEEVLAAFPLLPCPTPSATL